NPLLSTNPWYTFQVDLVRTLWTIFPATIFWGASFPLALAAAAPNDKDSAHLVGAIYAANTAGAIAGALAFSLIPVPSIGPTGAERLLIALSGAAALIALGPVALKSRAGSAALAASLIIAAILAANVHPVPGMLIAYGRRIITSMSRSQILYTGEG